MTEQDLLKKLFNLMEKRVSSTSKDSYVKSLLDQGKVKINEKVLEEALELLEATNDVSVDKNKKICLLYTSPSPRDNTLSRMPSSA